MSDQSSTQEETEETRSEATTTNETAQTYCWNSQTLAGMYNLPHQEASFSQDAVACKEYAEIISNCLDTLLNRCTTPPAWCSKEEELNVLKKCKLLMDNAAASERSSSSDDDDDGDSSINLHWLQYFPEYGSLVMAHAHPQQLAGTVSVSVLGLDAHEFGLHPAAAGGDGGGAGDGNKGYDYLSQSPTYKVLFVGTMDESDLDDFQNRFTQILSTARGERKGDKRSAAKGEQGHQFTPALIHAVLTQAKKCNSSKVVVPKGGFTDNGRHTGGKPRNTSFPLVRSFFQWCMIQSGDNNTTLFRRCMVFLDLFIANSWLDQIEQHLDSEFQTGDISSFPQVRIHLDWAMTILGSAALKFENLNVVESNCVSLLPLLEHAQELKKRIDEIQEKMQDVEAAEYHLPDLAAELEQPDAFRNPVLRLKPERPTPKTVWTFDEKRAKATRNIGHVPLLDSTVPFDVQKIHTWACSSLLHCSEKIEHAHLVIGTIERAFCERAEKGLESDILNEQDVDVLLKLVNRYRAVVHILLTTFGDAVSRKTEVYSRELLVVWVAYCLIFSSNRKLYNRIVPNMGVALKYNDLEHLVLSTKREWSLVHVVKCFLQKNYIPDRELFSQRCPEATFVMGEALSRSLLRQKFTAEQQASEQRVQEHWKKVQRKQRLVAQLKQELVEVQRCLEQAEQDRDELEESIDARRCYHLSYQERIELKQDRAELCRRGAEVYRLHKAVDDNTRQLVTARKAPNPVIQPLPRDVSIAHRWLFFLYMPAPMRALATMSFTAQQMLMPKPYLLKGRCSIHGIDANTVLSELRTPLPVDSITDFYNKHQSSASQQQGEDGCIKLRGVSLLSACLPLRIGSDNVEHMNSPEDGIWYPDAWRPRMAWLGGSNDFDSLNNTEFNPYSVKRELTVSYFTEQLDPEPNGKPNGLQWTMLQNGDRCSDRGNLAIATQDSRSSRLTKPEYLSFGKVRAFPLLQLRTVLASLLDASLPLNDPNVHKLIFQTIFHIGCISQHDEECYSFVWKRDIYDGDIVSTASAILNHLADGLCETPKNYCQLSLLGELCAFLAAWQATGRGEGGTQAAPYQVTTRHDGTSPINVQSITAMPAYENKSFEELRFADYSQGNRSNGTTGGGSLFGGAPAAPAAPLFGAAPAPAALKDISRRLARAAIQWTEDLEDQLSAATSDDECNTIRLKQCVLLRHAILCYAYGPVIDSADARNIITLTAKCRNLRLDDKSASLELCQLESKCLDRITAHLQELENFSRNREEYLTEAAQSVISTYLGELRWSQFHYTEGDKNRLPRFESRGKDGCVYTINILTGVVLVDGMPPSSLPAEILEHRLYRRSFGKTNFEVVAKNGLLETIRLFDGKRYRFFLNDDELHVEEEDESTGSTLELLNAFSISEWGNDLPVRLQKMHSHWFSRVEQRVILRGILFNERSPHFLLQVDRTCSSQSVKASCFVVPEHHSKDQVPSDCKRFDKLVILDPMSSVTRVLGKFERVDFIHCLKNCNDELFVNMPRFGLSFGYKDGVLHCQEIAGAALAESQFIRSTIRGFHRYLVLEHTTGDSTTEVIVPEGDISRLDSGFYSVNNEEAFDANSQWHRYRLHKRFGIFKANNRTARLRLAAIHAATSFCNIDQLFGMTGVERAAELIRQCWTSSPLSVSEKSSLRNLSCICESRHPTLALLCVDILRCSEQVAFLYPNTYDAEAPTFGSSFDCDEVNAYAYMQSIHWRNRRLLLSPDEQSRIFGQESGQVEAARGHEEIDVEAVSNTSDSVEQLEKRVSRILKKSPKANTIEPFPLSNATNLSNMEKDMYRELASSWSAHVETSPELWTLKDNWKSILNDLKGIVRVEMDKLESYLKGSVNRSPSHSHHRHLATEFLRLSNMLPTATATDFARTIYEPKWLTGFNPMLTKKSHAMLRDSILIWLRLCVLDDKLERLTNLDWVANEAEILKEVASCRIWDATQFPAWLVFEVEHGIQIRPEQFVVARHLLKNPGNIVQLNMGLGKTRVILPMLILHWSFHDLARRDRVPRLNILSNLFSEAYDFFSAQLCGSIARLKVFLLPFCRDIELDAKRLCAMMRLVEQCRRERGVFIVAPEHRLSLELKEVELYRSGQMDLRERMHKLCHSSGWQDVLDESDELLHHRFQLIYACGFAAELPEGTHRFQAPQLLFRCIREDARIRFWISKHPEFITLEEQVDSQSNHYCESFPILRINMHLTKRQVLSEFLGVLADSLILNPPLELDWLRGHPLQKDIRAVVVEPTLSANSLALLSRNHLNDVLALRGLLAGGIFVHCLQKRHRVEYGIACPGKKRIAVPFRGADVPARRAEFAQADCAIVLSCLSYYYGHGLDGAQIREAFETLLALGKEARRKHYHTWFYLVKPRMQQDLPPEEVTKLDCIEKIDLSNTRQFQKLLKYFQRNMKTINFWLNSCVFPDEMQYYPQRLTGTAWNLAESSGDGVIGFSGTNDNHRILPQQVKQFFFQSSDNSETDVKISRVWKKLMSTNGLMLSRILNHTSDCRELPMTSPLSSMLNMIKQSADAVHAIVDSGALFAGFENLEIAKLLLDHLPVSFPGIAFFDDSASIGQWKVLERSGRLLPKDQSPILESKAFAFFDEPRCRGSDLKLQTNAVALLTLGKKMCKDKFMQAAGRMRKLGHGQKLIIVAMKDVMDQVKNGIESLAVEAKHVLEWTMRNTFESNTSGLVPWAAQGLFHCLCTSSRNPDLVVEDDKASVGDLYAASFDEVLASEAVRCRLELLQRRFEDGRIQPKAASKQILAHVLEKANRYGTHSIKASHGADEECERELELQRELEEEEEIEIPRLKAASELDWSLSSIFYVQSPSQLPKNAGVMLTSKFIGTNLSPTSINLIGWTGRVYGSRNFFTTVISKGEETPFPLNHYLRLVDVGIFFPNGEVLLVSEHEADILIEKFWEMHETSKSFPWLGPVLFHLSFLRSSLDGTITGLSPGMMTLPRFESFQPKEGLKQDDLIAELQLLAGETVYRTKSRRRALKLMLQGNVQQQHHQRTCASAEPEHIVGMRGFSHCFAYSDLEQVCKEVSREQEANNLRLEMNSIFPKKEVDKTMVGLTQV